MNQSLPAAKHGRAGLLLDRLGLHEAHLGLAGRDNDRLGICGIIFLTLDLSSGGHNAEDSVQTCCLSAFLPHVPPHYFR
ncbi:hypothetical protein, partial [Primorskyibacter flagellatus]|uniref:hypothetical protein n=1 Tax=Primorskyibacter flagellatus TaxID=1387277 RepID=UPI001F488A16